MNPNAVLCALLVGSFATIGCGADPGGPVEPPPIDDEDPVCEASAAAGIEVTETDIHGGAPYALGYPPYAIEGCRLAYVARPTGGASSGELRLRDLATGNETVLAPASEEPRRPTAAGAWVAWEATIAGKAVVRAKGKGAAVTIEGAFDHAGEPRAAADAIAFTGWLGPEAGADTDVFLPETGDVTAIGKGPGQQRFADVSATHVAWADFGEDPDGTFDQNDSDLSDIVIHDRKTESAHVRERDGKQAFAMLGAPPKIAYLDWGAVHPEPKFSAYELRLGDLDTDVDVAVDQIETQQPYVRPVARGASIEWVQWPSGAGAVLLRRRVDLTTPAEELPGLDGLDLFGPTASAAITLVGTRAPGAPMTLEAFAR